MKNLFLITLLLLSFQGISQSKKPIDSFLDIKFGSTKAEVISAMKGKSLKPITVDNDTTRLYFPGVLFENITTDFLVVSFVGGKAYNATFKFPSRQSLAVYHQIVDAISKVHGKVEGTGNDLSDRVWTSKKDNNNITIFYSKDDSIMLGYTDKILSDLANAEQKTK